VGIYFRGRNVNIVNSGRNRFLHSSLLKIWNFFHSWKKSQIFNRDSCKNLLFSFFCFWVLMYMYNMLLRFEGRKNSAIYEHDMFTVNIYFFMRISRVLCFFKLFSVHYIRFFQSALNKATIAMLTFIIRSVFLTLFLVIKSCIQLVCVASLLNTRQ
jgi:hypothetical protein